MMICPFVYEKFKWNILIHKIYGFQFLKDIWISTMHDISYVVPFSMTQSKLYVVPFWKSYAKKIQMYNNS